MNHMLACYVLTWGSLQEQHPIASNLVLLESERENWGQSHVLVPTLPSLIKWVLNALIYTKSLSGGMK